MIRSLALVKIRTLAAMLRPYTTRLEIAGSIRRGKADVKDGELVAIAAPGLLPFFDHLVEVGVIAKAHYGANGTTRWGAKYRGLVWRGLRVEIFLTNEHSWGYQYWLRTGPGDANQFIMTRLVQTHAPFRFIEGVCWYAPNGWTWNAKRDRWEASERQQVSLPEEAHLFALLGLPEIRPDFRTEQVYRNQMLTATHRWGNPANHLIIMDEMVSQPTLFSLEATRVHEEKALPPEQPTAPRIHPVTVSAWTPALTAQYATQVYRESIEQFEKKAIALRRLAGGDRHSHYWRAADSALAAASALRGVQA
jgi:hypothetical protein